MSNYSRFINIWLEFDNVYRACGSDRRLPQAVELSNLLLWLKRWGEIDFTALTSDEEVKNRVRVKILTSVNGRPAPCNVLFYQGKESGYPSIRDITDQNGKGTFRVPRGKWNILVSHGFEFKAFHNILELSSDSCEQSVDLKPIVDLKERGWYGGELHHHSVFSSPVYGGTDDVTAAPDEVSLFMQASGCSFGALSDHHNTLNHQAWRDAAQENFLPVISKEISTSNGHVMSLGAEKDIIYEIPRAEKRTDTFLKEEFVRITEEIKDMGGVAQINHPVSESSATSWPMKFNDILNIFNAMEIWNGAHPMIENSLNDKSFDLWRESLNKGNRMTATAGSDTHYPTVDQYEQPKKEIHAIVTMAKRRKDELPIEIKSKVDILIDMWEISYPEFNKWINHSLGTGSVKNYFKLGNEVSYHAVKSAICSGRGFITNGPLVLMSAQGKEAGEEILCQGGAVDVCVEAFSQKPISKLKLYLGDGRILEKSVSENDFTDHHACFTFKAIAPGRAKWFMCAAGSDFTNLALTNPIYISG